MPKTDEDVAQISPASSDYLTSLTRVFTELLGPGEPESVIPRVLEQLGRLMGVDRVYLFENDTVPVNAPPSCSQRFEWARDAVEPQIDNPDLQGITYESFSDRWFPVLKAGGVIVGDIATFPAAERAVLEPQGIISILIVPISIDSRFWGFVGFDACRRRQDFGELERGVLRATSGAVAVSLRARRADAQLRLTAAVFETTHDGIAILDSNLRINELNAAFRSQHGVADEVIGKSIADIIEIRGEGADQSPWQAIGNDQRRWQGECSIVSREGTERFVWLTIDRIDDHGPAGRRWVAVFTDISPLKATEAKLKHLGEHDPLTGLPNRLALQDELARRIELGEPFALLFLDLDRFKTVNDSIGHPEGDRLLVRVARRTAEALPDGSYLVRLGGDEFIVLLPIGVERSVAQAHAWKVIACHDTAYSLGNRQVFSSVSIGLASYPEDTRDADELIQFAYAAMYQAKRSGRARVCLYDPEMTREARTRLQMETALRYAVDAGELVPWFQPQYRLSNGQVIGAELLLRWWTRQGQVLPETFIPIAEETGCIAALTVETLKMAAANWHELARAAGRPIRLAVNISATQFHRHDLVKLLADAIDEFELPPGALELEITESTLIADPSRVTSTLATLREAGVRIAIDDFGSGYSSLAMLRTLPIDHLKIDRAFVHDLRTPRGRTLLGTIIDMGSALDLDVSAEGIETQEQLDVLACLKCAFGQGFHLGVPQPIDDLRSLLERG